MVDGSPLVGDEDPLALLNSYIQDVEKATIIAKQESVKSTPTNENTGTYLNTKYPRSPKPTYGHSGQIYSVQKGIFIEGAFVGQTFLDIFLVVRRRL